MSDKELILTGAYKLRTTIKDMTNEEVCAAAWRLIAPGEKLFDDMIQTEYIKKATGKSHYTAVYRLQEGGFDHRKAAHVKMARRIVDDYAKVVQEIVEKSIFSRDADKAVFMSQKSS